MKEPQPKQEQTEKIPVIREHLLYGSHDIVGSKFGLKLSHSFCVAFVGVRGGGKTFSLAYIGAKALALNYTVYSNFPIKFYLSRGKGKSRLCESKPLDWDALYSLDIGIQNAVVLITEIQYFASSRRFMTLNNRLLNSIVQQMRHRNLCFYFDLKNLDWVDTQLRWETDIQILCRDAYFTPWGQDHNIKEEGELIFWSPLDMSGLLTHSMYPRMLKPYHLYVKPLRGIYNTHKVIDVLDAMMPIDLELEKRRLGKGNGLRERLPYNTIKWKTLEILRARPQIKRADFWQAFGDIPSEQQGEIKDMMPDWGIKVDKDNKSFILVSPPPSP